MELPASCPGNPRVATHAGELVSEEAVFVVVLNVIPHPGSCSRPRETQARLGRNCFFDLSPVRAGAGRVRSRVLRKSHTTT